jgi:hypothetical protein
MKSLFKEDSVESKVFGWVNLAGLGDIATAFLFIGHGFSSYVASERVAQSMYVQCVLIFSLLIAYSVRKYIIQPRFGYMKRKGFFSPKIGPIALLMTFLITLVCVLFIRFCEHWVTGTALHSMHRGFGLRELVGLSVGLILCGPWASKSFRIRIVIYYFVLVGGTMAAAYLTSTLGLSMAYHIGYTLPGLVIFGIGIREFVLFLKQYPAQTAEADAQYSK